VEPVGSKLCADFKLRNKAISLSSPLMCFYVEKSQGLEFTKEWRFGGQPRVVLTGGLSTILHDGKEIQQHLTMLIFLLLFLACPSKMDVGCDSEMIAQKVVLVCPRMIRNQLK